MLTHEVIKIKKKDVKKDPKKKKSKKKDEQEDETEEDKEARQIHLFRLKAIERDYMTHVSEWTAKKKAAGNERAGEAAPSQSNRAKNTVGPDNASAAEAKSEKAEDKGGCSVF